MIKILSWANNSISRNSVEPNKKCETYFDIKGNWRLCTSVTQNYSNKYSILILSITFRMNFDLYTQYGLTENIFVVWICLCKTTL